MVSLSPQTPFARPIRDDVIARALETSGVGSGGGAGSPCAFHPLGQAAASLVSALCPDGATGGAWVLVTVHGPAGVELRLRERSLTAVQRFMLALACDDVDSRWVAETPDTVAFRAAGVDLAGRRSIGLVWYASP